MHLRHLSGEHIQAGGRGFVESGSPRSAATWEGALRELVSEGFVQSIGVKGEMFKVTREGYDFYDSHLKEQS